ncbi:condensin complex subunit 2 [Venturia canescens]|uniref:condensin complex subunit 2 n=1 Tax=Venturia canescens TaxID=32260 RepID=UPI001C9D4E7E|nr:condensin complex subunit 2 [Venturia canescens]
MTSRKSLMHPVVEELRNGTPSVSSPLRRRSSIAQHRPVSTDLEENDDEAERLVRRREKNQSSGSLQDKRRSMDLGLVAQMSHPQIAEKVSQCIKLSTENKINMKNAFSLEMIDFMSYMIKKKDGNMSNLQVASTSLDVSTKIYGFRVDGVHTDILKMAGAMHDNKDKDDGRKDQGGDDENMETGEGEEAAGTQNRVKKKRKSKQKLIVAASAVKGIVETVNPASLMFSEADSQTTDLLYLAILPYHANKDIYLNLHNDVILDRVDPTKELNIDSTVLRCPKIRSFNDDDMCQSFANFDFLGWSPDDEAESLSPGKSQSFHEDLQFDLDASLPPNEESNHTGVNYFDIEEDENMENMDRCRGPLNRSRQAIVDLRQVVQASKHHKNSEYSYFLGNLDFQWDGPSHWKIKFANKNLGGSRIVEGCAQEAIKRRKELVLTYNDEMTEICDNKFDTTRNNCLKLQSKTTKNYWSEEKLTLPQDIHYDSAKCSQFYLRCISVNVSQKDRMNATHVSDEVGDYDYNNELDTTDYCPNIGTDDQPPNEDGIHNTGGFDGADEMTPMTQAFTGDNLVEAPKVNSKIFIPFSQRAKKIDMRQLKKSIWKQLSALDIQRENIEPQSSLACSEKMVGTKNFNAIYKNLPKMLSKTNSEALSFPIAVISLLHIANEKCLEIKSNEDYSDLIIRQN